MSATTTLRGETANAVETRRAATPIPSLKSTKSRVMKGTAVGTAVVGLVLTLACPGTAYGDWKTEQAGFRIKNYLKNKTLTSWKIEMSGDGEFGVTEVTDADGTPLSGFTVKVTNKAGGAVIELTGGNLAHGQAKNIIVKFN